MLRTCSTPHIASAALLCGRLRGRAVAFQQTVRRVRSAVRSCGLFLVRPLMFMSVLAKIRVRSVQGVSLVRPVLAKISSVYSRKLVHSRTPLYLTESKAKQKQSKDV